MLFAILLGAIFGSGFLIGDTTGIIAVIVGFAIWFLCIAVAALLYAPWMMARTNGQTLGRMAVGIRVVRARRPADRLRLRDAARGRRQVAALRRSSLGSITARDRGR